MQRGSLVVCNTNFEEERAQYPQHAYPHRGDLRVVRGFVSAYPSGTLLLTFEESYHTLRIPLSENCFDELQTPEEGDAILSKVQEIFIRK